MITLLRIIKTGLRNFVRNAWLSTAATAVMTVTLSLVAVSYIANAALTSAIQEVVNKIDISIFLNDTNTPEQNQVFKSKLEQAPNVKSVRFLTKSDALKEYRRQNADNPKLLEGISETDNPLPASFQIKAKDPNKIDGIINLANQPEFKPLLAPKNPISYSGKRKATIDKIISTSNFLRASGIIASVIFIVISTLIIFNTIRMAIFTRREEIEIMKLVGATSWFIRGPFIFEAILYGVIAAILALIFLYTVVLNGAPRIASYIP
ncbi:MAG TPA: permease-like cell division protein FtsX, partial [Candidatus Polarisedimenticolaceae bacterium]|nr:permease-like cell division protein FtsX [Candidatus Polarisedimenticolaceae bacterium]